MYNLQLSKAFVNMLYACTYTRTWARTYVSAYELEFVQAVRTSANIRVVQACTRARDRLVRARKYCGRARTCTNLYKA